MRQNHHRERDLRIDFFRGLALIFIFINHIPDNGWALATSRNFGFSDASEVFVLLAGFSAGLVYFSIEERGGFRAALQRAAGRARQIYLWHLGVFLVSALVLFVAAQAFGKPSYVNNIGVAQLATDPVSTLLWALTLVYQPNMMNILPMYVVLMLWLPFIIVLLRQSVALTLLISFCIWLVVNVTGFNLPAFQRPGEGWFFNPFAWQLLFTLGAAAALVSLRPEAVARPRVEILVPAAAYVIFALVVAAPWVAISWLPDGRLIPRDILGADNKSYLSVWRLLHVLALAYLVAALVPRNATWLKQSWANMVTLCGKHSLEIFSLGTLLSFFGWIALAELGSSQMMMAAVNVAGIAIMSMTAWQLSRRKEARRALAARPSPVQALAS